MEISFNIDVPSNKEGEDAAEQVLAYIINELDIPVTDWWIGGDK